MATFSEGQKWTNPDGLSMNIISIKNGWVHYLTEQNEFGKETEIHMKEWLELGAIELSPNN